MAYLTRAVALAEVSGVPVHYAPTSPVKKLESMLQKAALEVEVLNYFWTGDD